MPSRTPDLEIQRRAKASREAVRKTGKGCPKPQWGGGKCIGSIWRVDGPVALVGDAGLMQSGPDPPQIGRQGDGRAELCKKTGIAAGFADRRKPAR